MATKNEVVYFTKLRGLESVVWDPKKDRPLAEFDKQGLYSTTKPDVAKRLKELGYREVTADQIKDAGLMLPEEFAKFIESQPGRGYTHDGQGNVATAAPQAPAGPPEGFPDGPQAGNRTLVG